MIDITSAGMMAHPVAGCGDCPFARTDEVMGGGTECLAGPENVSDYTCRSRPHPDCPLRLRPALVYLADPPESAK